jgi:hypothetical protein
MRLSVWSIAALALAAGSAQATTILSRTTDQLFHDADIVATVDVGDVHAEQVGGHITTHATLVVTEAFKGATRAVTLHVVLPGGVVGRWGQHVEGAPTLVSGEHCVVFLHQSRSLLQFVGLEQGKLTITADPAKPSASVIRRTAGARFVERGADGLLHEATLPPETEPLEPYLQHLRNLGGAR